MADQLFNTMMRRTGVPQPGGATGGNMYTGGPGTAGGNMYAAPTGSGGSYAGPTRGPQQPSVGPLTRQRMRFNPYAPVPKVPQAPMRPGTGSDPGVMPTAPMPYSPGPGGSIGLPRDPGYDTIGLPRLPYNPGYDTIQ